MSFIDPQGGRVGVQKICVVVTGPPPNYRHFPWWTFGTGSGNPNAKFKLCATLCRLFIFEQERHLWVSLSIKFIIQWAQWKIMAKSAFLTFFMVVYGRVFNYSMLVLVIMLWIWHLESALNFWYKDFTLHEHTFWPGRSFFQQGQKCSPWVPLYSYNT